MAKMRVFASRYLGLAVTWPKGQVQKQIKFIHGRFATEDQALADHLLTLEGVREITSKGGSDKEPEPKVEDPTTPRAPGRR